MYNCGWLKNEKLKIMTIQLFTVWEGQCDSRFIKPRAWKRPLKPSKEMKNFDLKILTLRDERLSILTIQSTLYDRKKKKGLETDIFVKILRKKMVSRKPLGYCTSVRETLLHKNTFYVA